MGLHNRKRHRDGKPGCHRKCGTSTGCVCRRNYNISRYKRWFCHQFNMECTKHDSEDTPVVLTEDHDVLIIKAGQSNAIWQPAPAGNYSTDKTTSHWFTCDGTVEDLPFLWIGFQAFAIGRQPIEAKRVDAALHSFADLMPYPAEARPVHAEPRQDPLQKHSTISVVHDASSFTCTRVPDLGHGRECLPFNLAPAMDGSTALEANGQGNLPLVLLVEGKM